MSRPFFSIIIPTYKRPTFLRAAIKMFIDQTFDDFEIVIVDDCSPDNTAEVVESIKDRRIRYYRNRKNLGQEGNFKKAFGMGVGEYLFISGNDDYVLWPDTLEKVHKVIKEKKYGFVRLNIIEKKFVGKGLRKSIIDQEKDIVIPKNSNSEEVFNFFRHIAVGLMAGLIFKREGDISSKMFDLQETPWVKVLYDVTHKYGALFLSKHYMVVTWSQMAILYHYDVKKGRPIMVEQYINFIISVLPFHRRSAYRLNYYEVFAKLQPAIKLYSSNTNLIKFDKRLFELEPQLKKSILLWAMLVISLITPKFIWRFVRVIQHNHKNYLNTLPNLKSIYRRNNYLEKHYFRRELRQYD